MYYISTFYKDYLNIKKSSIGGYIASNNIETCAGICLLHPERTASYDKIIEIARSKTLLNQRSFIFYGSDLLSYKDIPTELASESIKISLRFTPDNETYCKSTSRRPISVLLSFNSKSSS